MELKNVNWKNKIRCIAAFFAVSMACQTGMAQEKTNVQEKDTTAPVFHVVEYLPEFPGGEDSLKKFLVDNIVYPKRAVEQEWEGRVVIGFVVEVDGSLSGIKVLRSSGHVILDEEALRVAKSMPNWIPGKQRGKNVRVQFQIPVIFSLDKPKK